MKFGLGWMIITLYVFVSISTFLFYVVIMVDTSHNAWIEGELPHCLIRNRTNAYF